MNSSNEVPTALQVVVALFQKLNEQDIRYCHWKSTQGLPEAISGRTDLDILVDRSHSRRFKEILYQSDFKPFMSDPIRQFPAVEDYLGFDQETGRLVHLHIHYRLVLGEQYVKNHYLPLEESFLDNTQIRSGVKVPTPELETIVLVLRALLKYRDRDVVRDIARLGRSSGLPTAILGEFKYLLAQTNLEDIADTLDKHVDFISPDLIFEFLTTIQKSPRSGWTLYRLRRQVRRDLAPYQRYNRLRARAIYYRIMLSRQWPWPFSRLFRRFRPKHNKRKIPMSGGLRVAFVGADGAGKSTVIKHVVKWLSWRLNVRTYYMGNTQPSAVTKILESISKLTQLVYGGCRRLFGEKSIVTRLSNGPRQFLTYLRFLADGRDRYNRYLASQRKAGQGSIIIYDRYPLEAIRIFGRAMDGSRIASRCEGHMGPVTKKLSQAEENIYQKIRPPEHLFVLHVSPEVSQARKPDHKPELVEAKSQAIAQIRRDGLNLTEINAEQPLDQVLLQIKSTLWRLL